MCVDFNCEGGVVQLQLVTFGLTLAQLVWSLG